MFIRTMRGLNESMPPSDLVVENRRTFSVSQSNAGGMEEEHLPWPEARPVF